MRITRPAIIEGEVAKIPLGKNAKDGYALVDVSNAFVADLCNWSLSKTGYADGWPNGVHTHMHRFLGGPTDNGLVVDHISRDKLDNRASNIRLVTQRVNTQNVSLRKNSKSGHRGVTWLKDLGKWRAVIGKIHVGVYTDIEDAIKARKVAEMEHGYLIGESV